MPYHKTGAYDGFDTLDEAKEYYRRCRKTQCFKLSKDSQFGEYGKSLICNCCGKPISDKTNHPAGYQGNFCWYFPKTRKVIVMHYTCSWQNLFNKIAKFQY